MYWCMCSVMRYGRHCMGGWGRSFIIISDFAATTTCGCAEKEKNLCIVGALLFVRGRTGGRDDDDDFGLATRNYRIVPTIQCTRRVARWRRRIRWGRDRGGHRKHSQHAPTYTVSLGNVPSSSPAYISPLSVLSIRFKADGATAGTSLTTDAGAKLY